MNEKIKLRENFLSKRLSLQNIQEKNQRILQEIRNSVFMTKSFFCSFASYKNEPDLSDLFNYFPDKRFFYPKILSDSKMDFYEIKNYNQLKPGKYNILEPDNKKNKNLKFLCSSESIIFFVPGLAFDLTGNRLGYGKGYYDHFFHNLTIPKKFYTLVGICFSELVTCQALPAESRDVAMDFIITEKNIRKCDNEYL